MVQLKCNKCPHLKENIKIDYCTKLNILLENGNAKAYHSLHCGEKLSDIEQKHALFIIGVRKKDFSKEKKERKIKFPSGIEHDIT